ncbi:GerAB/ArcD/ProY family transporter [Brevibacillus centrosporus]|uniref:GerAB/ArcD/ProY family transporter n=1 Tax=Brevibacillus centrosporus TaxID=54910 RepID=UPI000F0A6F11|nr:GerAB/ArcD/ProY family transporter [Brevibacillus centrosporus]RNB72355.1 hypothetical protein EDM55_05975 [Brevibacillus centrosporus]GED33180.1 hypothetical protein BCE02nite_43210 [Brevibacillus centrosporus]
MKVPQQITVIQVVTILVSTIIGVGVLALPLFAVRTADSGAPFVTFLGTCLAFFGVIIITILGKRYPSKTIIIYSEDIIGKWLARIGSLLVIGFFAVLTSLTAREFGEVVVTAVLKSTPVEITVIVMLLLAAISTRSDIFTFTYIHQFYFPFLLVPVLEEKSNEKGLVITSALLEQIERQDEQGAVKFYEGLIKQTQAKSADIFGFGEYVRAMEPQYWNQKVKTKERWQEMYKDITVDLQVNIEIRRVGMKAR